MAEPDAFVFLPSGKEAPALWDRGALPYPKWRFKWMCGEVIVVQFRDEGDPHGALYLAEDRDHPDIVGTGVTLRECLDSFANNAQPIIDEMMTGEYDNG